MSNASLASGSPTVRKVLLTGAAALAILSGGYFVGSSHGHAAPIVTSDLRAPLTPSFAPLAERVRPAVVSVRVVVDGATMAPRQASALDALPPQLREFFQRFGEQNGTPPQQPVPKNGVALGSGFFVSADGFIVTNNHVVENAKSVSVTTDDGHVLDARVVGTDPKTDLALLKVTEKGDYPFVAMAQEAPKVGDWVMAIGNPFGLGGSVTAGIVSANGRDLGAGPYDDFLQIDAPINKGNSGGPTFNLKGEVVGVNTMIFSPSGGSVGLAFAIPASTVVNVVKALETDGVVPRGYLGVQVQGLDQAIADSLGLRSTNGALVDEVVPGTPAAKAGLRSGDIITAVNGAAVKEARDFTRQIGALKPGDAVDLTFVRGGREQEARLTLGRQQVTEKAIPAKASADEATPMVLGVQLASARDVAGMGGPGVVIVGVDPNGAAAEKGIASGDIILEVAGKPVSRPAEVKAEIASARHEGKGAVLFKIRNAEASRYVAFALPKA